MTARRRPVRSRRPRLVAALSALSRIWIATLRRLTLRRLTLERSQIALRLIATLRLLTRWRVTRLRIAALWRPRRILAHA